YIISTVQMASVRAIALTSASSNYYHSLKEGSQQHRRPGETIRASCSYCGISSLIQESCSTWNLCRMNLYVQSLMRLGTPLRFRS
ncbi:MAG: hypothetical protein WBL68_07080, partial [Nitrososphaeraceae archaeon]